MIHITIESAEVSGFSCDALVLKYAQAFYGADAIVAATLAQARHGELQISPKPGDHVLISSEGAVAADAVDRRRFSKPSCPARLILFR